MRGKVAMLCCTIRWMQLLYGVAVLAQGGGCCRAWCCAAGAVSSVHFLCSSPHTYCVPPECGGWQCLINTWQCATCQRSGRHALNSALTHAAAICVVGCAVSWHAYYPLQPCEHSSTGPNIVAAGWGLHACTAGVSCRLLVMLQTTSIVSTYSD
jgi:hypothetical protein